jgi:hypothetical protein
MQELWGKMLKPQGQITIAGDVHRIAEYDTISCGHCGQIVRVKPGTGSTVYITDKLHVEPITRKASIIQEEEMGAFCRVCMTSICLQCHDFGDCTPLLKKIEAIEARGRMLKSLGL